MLTHTLVVTPLPIVPLLFTNDFVTVSIATDRVSFSKKPDRWRLRSLVMTAAPLAGFLVVFSLPVLFVGRNVLFLSTGQIQTLAFFTLVFGGQGTVYLVRERGHLWRSCPSGWMLWSSGADLAIVSTLAARGILMASLPAFAIGSLLGAVIIYLFVIDYLKIAVFQHFRVA